MARAIWEITTPVAVTDRINQVHVDVHAEIQLVYRLSPTCNLCLTNVDCEPDMFHRNASSPVKKG